MTQYGRIRRFIGDIIFATEEALGLMYPDPTQRAQRTLRAIATDLRTLDDLLESWFPLSDDHASL